MRNLVLLVALCLSGCAGFFSGPVPARDEIFATVKLVDDLPYGRLGEAACYDGYCTIHIRRDTYPACLQHELRHGFEPDFHAGRESDEDCYYSEQ